jgi:MutL-like protein
VTSLVCCIDVGSTFTKAALVDVDDGHLVGTAARPTTSSTDARASGRSLARVALVVGSGGVLRHGDERVRRAVLQPATSDFAGGWAVPQHARAAVDERYVLAAAGLLAAEHSAAASRLLHEQLRPIC